jgi:hypothetical protein
MPDAGLAPRPFPMRTRPARRRQGWGVPMSPEPSVVERCCYCDFTVSAPLEEARQAFQAHVCARPRPTSTKRRRSSFSTIRR